MNTSGVIPLDLRVIVLPDPVEEKTAGGIIIPDSAKEADRWATTRGTLVAVGCNAWCEAHKNPDFQPPQPGERVLFAKYGKRAEIKGPDGTEYWIMNDEDVLGRLKE